MTGSTITQRIGLVGCVSKKAVLALPARELYLSALFLGRRAMVERTCARWFILSARHGLLSPDVVTGPYDQSLKQASSAERRAWSQSVLSALDAAMGSLVGCVIEIHAGAEYRAFGIEAGLLARGALVEVPARGLGIGRQLAFYKRERNR